MDMKQYWQQTLNKIDALSLRERVIVFALVNVVVVCLFTVLVFDKQFARIKQLSGKIASDQASIEQARTETRLALINYQDPNANNRQRLKALQQELPVMQGALVDMQKGLVSPERMPALLEAIIKPDWDLHLVSLKTLPVQNLMAQGLTDLAPSNAKSALSVATALMTKPDTTAVYTHGVELVIEGKYFQLLDYMTQLESMPWQLLWSKASLEVKQYPVATMTLTVYSLSLDKNWLHL